MTGRIGRRRGQGSRPTICAVCQWPTAMCGDCAVMRAAGDRLIADFLALAEVLEPQGEEL